MLTHRSGLSNADDIVNTESLALIIDEIETVKAMFEMYLTKERK